MKIALAGGTGALGRYIVDAFIDSGRLDELVILSRQSKDDFPAKVVAVDYSDTSATAKALRDLGADTLVSVIASASAKEYQESQDRLIDVAIASKTVQRFIPSEWGGNLSVTKDLPEFMQSHQAIRKKLEASGLEYTACNPGIFMDYLLPGGPKYHAPWNIPVRPQVAKAFIPGDGLAESCLTLTADVASGLLVLFDAPKGSWNEDTYFNGDIQTWNNVLSMAQNATGKSFDVQNITEDDLRLKLETAKESGNWWEAFVTELELWGYFQGGYKLPPRSKVFDELRFTTIQDVLDEYKK
jgi:NmrA-like family